MTKNQLKRIAAPASWEILRKTTKMITKPNPGKHSLELCMPLKSVLVEVLKIAGTKAEVIKMLHTSTDGVLIDGKRIKDKNYGVGLMDTIHIPQINSTWRVIINKKSKIEFVKVNNNEKDLKILKVKSKKNIKGNKQQISFHDGRVIISDDNKIKVGMSVLFDLTNNKIKEVYGFDKGNTIYIYEGKNVGLIGTIDSVKEDRVLFKTGDTLMDTDKNYVFIIGKGKKEILHE